MPDLRTVRLLLIPATAAALRAELESPRALARVLRVHVPESWPPELYDADAVRWTLRSLESNPADVGWGFYYVAEAPVSPETLPRLVGAGGYKGGPSASGTVEIGYAVVPERRRLGYAREAVYGWLAHAFADTRVRRVIAHTLPELAPSIAVLHSAGFSFIGAGDDPTEPTAIAFELSREGYEQRGSGIGRPR
ncbi:MAG: GNAT family N-acetyltransferase [Gemmatimonadaceae bacterium]